MENDDMAAAALIIAEFTGSISAKELRKLNRLRSSSAEVTTLSEFIHTVLDPKRGEILPVQTSAEEIIKLGNVQRTSKLKLLLARALMYLHARKK